MTLLTTGRCNLACDYCYQDPSPSVRRHMDWRVAQTAIDRLLAVAPARAALEISGGEPLTAPALVRRIVAHARSADGTPDRLDLILTTNGTLLTASLVGFLVDHDVILRISHDGVRGAQGARGSWTFPVLERTLADMGRRHPDYFARRVTVVTTVTGLSVAHLAASVAYFVARGVTQTDIGPRMTIDGDWTRESAGTLRMQVDEVVDACLRLWQRERRCPVSFLQGADTAPLPSVPLCTALSGHGFCVDPAGHCWACPVLSPALRTPDPSTSAPLSVLDLGDLDDPALDARLLDLPERVRSCALGRRPRKCAGCGGWTDCAACPATFTLHRRRGLGSGFPELPCAFSRTTQAARRSFRQAIGDAVAKRFADGDGDVRRALRSLQAVIGPQAETSTQGAALPMGQARR